MGTGATGGRLTHPYAGALLAVLALPCLSACGSASPGALSASNASALHRDVQRIRTAAAGHDAGQAHAAVAALRHDVTRLETRGELAPSDAHMLVIEAGQVDQRVSVEVKAVAAPVITSTSGVALATSTTAPPDAVAPPASGDGNGNGSGSGSGESHGAGHGHGGDGGD